MMVDLGVVRIVSVLDKEKRKEVIDFIEQLDMDHWNKVIEQAKERLNDNSNA